MERNTFDSLFTTGRLQMLKVLLPCLPPDRQGGLAVYIKMQELLYTIGVVQRDAGRVSASLGPAPSGEALCERLLPFCDPSQKDQISRFQQMNRQMESMMDMMETMRMLQEMFPEGMGGENMDLSQIMGMFTDENIFPGFGPQKSDAGDAAE